MSIGADLWKSLSAKITSDGNFQVEMYVSHWHIAGYSWKDQTIKHACVIVRRGTHF